MGVQGNYPGSGATTKHYQRATGHELPHGTNVDSHLKEGGDRSSGIVEDSAMPKGRGSAGNSVRAVNQE